MVVGWRVRLKDGHICEHRSDAVLQTVLGDALGQLQLVVGAKVRTAKCYTTALAEDKERLAEVAQLIGNDYGAE